MTLASTVFVSIRTSFGITPIIRETAFNIADGGFANLPTFFVSDETGAVKE